MNDEVTIFAVGVGTEGAKRLGKAIKVFRLWNKLTPTQLAEKVEVTPSFIRAIERGDQSPSLETAMKIFEHIPCEDVEIAWNYQDGGYDLSFQQEGREMRFLFSAAVRGQNNRNQGSRLIPVYVAMRIPREGESGSPQLLGVYDEKVLAEARCFRDLGSMQMVGVFDCILNEDREV